MRIINFQLDILDQKPNREGLLKHIEKCARVCYKSEAKIAPGTAEKMVDTLIRKGHTAMLEHGTVYLTVPIWKTWVWKKYVKDPYTKVHFEKFSMYITTNYRVLCTNNNWTEDWKYVTLNNEPTEFHERRLTVKFTISRAIANEFVRHRGFSFAQESTRYCNYTVNKFNNELVFVGPAWFDVDRVEYNVDDVPLFKQGTAATKEQEYARACYECEQHYKNLIKLGCLPQEARGVLTLDLKTELVMTGFESQWKDFFKLRCDSHAQVEAREAAEDLRRWMRIRNYKVD